MKKMFPKNLLFLCRSPKYLKHTAEGELSCPCGCNRFFYNKREKTEEEEIEEYLSFQRLKNDYALFGPVFASGKEGQIIVRKQFLWFHWKERNYNDYRPRVMSFPYISLKCEKCEKEVVLFDGRTAEGKLKLLNINYGDLGPPNWSKEAFEIKCFFDYPDDTENDMGFERIRVYACQNNKRKLLLDFEL